MDSEVPSEGFVPGLFVSEGSLASMIPLAKNDTVSRDGDPSILESAGRHDFLREGGVGGPLVVLAAPAVIREEARSGREPILHTVVFAVARGALQVPVRFVPGGAIAVDRKST